MAANRTRALLAGAGVSAILISGCGSGGYLSGRLSFKGHPHPAATVDVSVAVIGRDVSVSPARLGSGPMIFNVVNATGHRESITIGTRHGHVALTTGAIPAGGTAQVKAQIASGHYYVHASVAKSGSLDVGAPRRGGDNLIEQP